MLLCWAASAAGVVDLAGYVRLKVTGFGRYASAPAFFLSESGVPSDGGDVLPVPMPLDSVMAIEQVVAPGDQAMLEVLLHGRTIVNRDGGIFDSLPWEEWAVSPQAKRDGFSRFTGRDYPQAGYGSPYHMLVDMMQEDCCAEVAHVVIENTDVLGDLVLGGALVVERRLVPPMSSSVTSEPMVCACTPDEALGVAVALQKDVFVDVAVWEAAALVPSYVEQRGKLRIASGVGRRTIQLAEDDEVPPPLPWELRSDEELLRLSLKDKARSALAAGLRLPRAREATEEVRQCRTQPGCAGEKEGERERGREGERDGHVGGGS